MDTYKIAEVNLSNGNELRIVYDGYHSGVMFKGAWLIMGQGKLQFILELSEGKATIYGTALIHA